MARERSLASLIIVLSVACSPEAEDRIRAAIAAQAEAPPAVFDLIEDQAYVLPDDAPDELLRVPSRYFAQSIVSLRDGNVISAWITTDGPDGAPSEMVYRCARDAAGVHRWIGAPRAFLTPLGVDVTELPDLLPFTATHTLVDAPNGFFGAGPALGFTLDATARAAALPSRSLFAGVEDATLPGAHDGDLPIARLRKTHGLRSGVYGAGAFEHADHVLRLCTDGGAGPGAGAICAPGEPEQRVPFSAQYWFVRMSFSAERAAEDDDD